MAYSECTATERNDMASRWQVVTTAFADVPDAGSEASMTGRERYSPVVSAHVRVAWPPGTDLDVVRRTVAQAAEQAVTEAIARAQRGGR